MALPSLVALGSLGLGIVGTLTATDVVSLREVAHAVDLPLISGAIVMARESMPGSLAHALEPVAAVLGTGVLVAPGAIRLWRRSVVLPDVRRLAYGARAG